MRNAHLKELLNNASGVRSKDNVISALTEALQPGPRVKGIKKFVNYYFAHEKQRDAGELSQSELAFVLDKCQAALMYSLVVQPPRVKRLHTSQNLQGETVIHATERTHGDHNGTRGWVGGWLTSYPTNAHVVLKLDTPMMVTRLMIYAVNVKASPRSMELYAKMKEGDEWVHMRSFFLRRRDFEGSHGNDEYTKNEMFYLLGHASNQEEFDTDDWEVHPLAGPGETTAGEPDLYLNAAFWKWCIVNNNGAGYCGINDFILYGREAPLPAPLNPTARAEDTGVKICWDPFGGEVEVDHYIITAYPGGFGHHSNGGFCEDCAGTANAYLFLQLSSGVSYQFQVVAVNAEGQEGVPSRVTAPVTVREWKASARALPQTATEDVLEPQESGFIEYESLDGSGTPLQPCVCDQAVSGCLEYETLVPDRQDSVLPDTESAFQEMLRGNFAVVDQLANSNKVTLYISGSLEDTYVERKYISQYAIPKLKLWCHANGYDFSGIDLRWGLISEIADDHKTYTIHMEELARVYKSSALTFFYFISGEKYGSVLLPTVISNTDRDIISSELKDSMRWIMDVAYQLDKNAEPPVYILQSIADIESSTNQKFYDGDCRGVHSLMKEIMTVMAKSAHVSQDLKQREPSLAIAECAYALNAARKSNRNKFLCGRRTLENLYQAMESERDLPYDKQKAKEMGCIDTVERRIIYDLRSRLVSNPCVMHYAYSFDWKKDGIDISREDMAMKRLCSRLYQDVKKLIEEEFANRKVFDEDEQEMVHHATFVQKRSASFYGRDNLIRTSMANIAATDGKITVLHGVSGAGKTSVMCTCAARASVYLPEDTTVIVRLCGTSPQSSSAKGIIKSICMQISLSASGEKDSLPEAFDELVEHFHTTLEEAAETAPLAIFIDSLDQLSDEDAGRSQPWKWIPKELPENVFFVISTLPDSEYGILQTLKEIYPRQIQVPLVPPVESHAILSEWMQQCHRTLTSPQKLAVDNCLNELQSGISMLHLRLIFDRICVWQSDYVPQTLPLTVQGIIELTYEELEREHGEKLVAGFLSLLGASKDGLSAENVIDILSADEDALGGKGRAGTILEENDPPVRRVPPYLLTRLTHDLREYLVERGANGMQVFGLYHRQFIEVAHHRYLQAGQNRLKAYRQLVEYFSGESANKFIERSISAQPFWFFLGGDDRVPNKQKLVELPHALLSSGSYEDHADLIMNYDYIEAKCTAGGVYASSLMEDYIISTEKLEPGEKQRSVRCFFRFITTWFHVLKRTPSCLTSLCLNYVPGNPVTERMTEKWEQRLGCQEAAWIEWDNAPTAIDPCLFTNVVSRAECITAIKCSPDAQSCVVAGNRFCGVYDFRTYQLQCDFKGHTSWIRSVCFSPDGRYVLSASNDTTAQVWNSRSAEKCASLEGHLSWVVDCDWSPMDHIVLTVSEDGTARLWNPYLGDLVGVHEEQGAALRCGTFSPSGQQVVTGDVDGKIMKWSVPDCKVSETAQLEKIINCLQWNASAKAIAAATSGGEVVLFSESLETLQSFEGFSFSVNRCVFSPDGTELLAAGAERVGNIYRVEDGALMGRLVGHSRQILGVDWIPAPEGSYLLTGSEDQTVKQWQRSDVIPGDVFETFAEGSWKPTSTFALEFSCEGDLYGIDGDSRLFHCADVLCSAKDEVTPPFLVQYGQGPKMGDKTASALTPDSDIWAIASYGHSSQMISRESGTELRTFSLDVCHNTLVWDPLGKPRFLASGHGNNAVIWDASSGERDCTLDIETWVWDGDWSRNGKCLVVAHDDNTVVFDMMKEYETGSTVEPVFKALDARKCAVNSTGSRMAIIAKTGKYYDSANSAGFLYDLSDLENVEEPMALEGRFEHSGDLIFTSDDKYLLVTFSSQAFGSSPSICAFDAEFGVPVAWFVSPLNNDFSIINVPYKPSSEFVAMDSKGKLYIFHVEEA